MSLRTVLRLTDGWQLSGKDISKSFAAKTFCEDTVVTFYVRCLIDDEGHHGPDTVGYRIFLEPKIAELLLAPKDEYNANLIAKYIKEQYNAQQILEARHIFVPVCYKLHLTVYVINKNYEQIDILDSWTSTVNDKQKYHQKIAVCMRKKLSNVISLISKEHPNFSDWSMPIIPAKYIAQQEPSSMDCGFFVMMFMKHYNPDTRQLEFCDSDFDDIRGKILWYLLHHNLNASADSLPPGIIDRGSPSEQKWFT
ncbi:hypothetical protein PVAP13_7NG117585 [Panicum virgatum]|nr:hypothetical protein PVAP13_7NG117585 [Panicum virgatum]